MAGLLSDPLTSLVGLPLSSDGGAIVRSSDISSWFTFVL